ncbi:MAG: SRPBCC domain-containing protein [Spirochaetota bacterium]
MKRQWSQKFDYLEKYLQQIQENPMNPNLTENVYSLNREFKAPASLVFDTWTQKEHLLGWYKPPGFTLEHKDFDVKVGGKSLHALTAPNGWKMWELHRYQEVDKPKKLSYIHSFSNEQGEITANPQSPNWPKQTLITISFSEEAGVTKVSFELTPHEASEEEVQAFNESLNANTKGGWTMAFDNLAQYINSLQN